MPTNPDVDAWFERDDNPMRPVVQRLRELVLAADPRIEATTKGRRPHPCTEKASRASIPRARHTRA
jgi:hypothetical protein